MLDGTSGGCLSLTIRVQSLWISSSSLDTSLLGKRCGLALCQTGWGIMYWQSHSWPADSGIGGIFDRLGVLMGGIHLEGLVIYSLKRVLEKWGTSRLSGICHDG